MRVEASSRPRSDDPVLGASRGRVSLGGVSRRGDAPISVTLVERRAGLGGGVEAVGRMQQGDSLFGAIRSDGAADPDGRG